MNDTREPAEAVRDMAMLLSGFLGEQGGNRNAQRIVALDELAESIGDRRLRPYVQTQFDKLAKINQEQLRRIENQSRRIEELQADLALTHAILDTTRADLLAVAYAIGQPCWRRRNAIRLALSRLIPDSQIADS